MAVNWKKGFRRVALICAVLAAIAGAIVGFKGAGEELRQARDRLRFLEKGKGMSQSFLLDEWKECTSLEVQEWHLKYLMGCTSLECQEWRWKFFTGEDLEESFKKSAVAEKNYRKKPLLRLDEVDKYTWTLSQESRERLKEQGWQTVNGELLPYTPFEVILLEHSRSLKKARLVVRNTQLFSMLLATAFWGAVGFVGVWLVYLILDRLVSWTACLILWVASGFHDSVTEQKSGDEDEQVTKC